MLFCFHKKFLKIFLELMFLWHLSFLFYLSLFFKNTLNKLSFSVVKYIFFQCFFIYYQTALSQLTTQHKPINLERTHQTQQTKNETSKHFGPSTNPLNWEWTQQLYTPNQHNPNHNSNQPKSTIQISINPTQQICKPTQITYPNPSPNFPKEKKEDLTFFSFSFSFSFFFEGKKRT